MSPPRLEAIRGFLEYAFSECQLLKNLDIPGRIKKIHSHSSYLQDYDCGNRRRIYGELLDFVIDTYTNSDLPYIPHANHSTDSALYRLSNYMTKNYSAKRSDFEQELEQFKQLFNLFAVDCIKHPLRMIDADNAKACRHYLFFGCLHLKLIPGNNLPRFELEIDGDIEDITNHQAEFLGNIPAFLNSRELTAHGMLTFKRLLLYIFMRKTFGKFQHISLISLLMRYDQLASSEDCKELDKNHFFHSSRLLSIFRTIAIKSDSVNFFKIYRGLPVVSWVDHVNTCRFIVENHAQLEQWKRYDERVYNFLIRNKPNDLGFNIFSPQYLIAEYGLRDKRSVKTLMQSNNTLFTSFTDSMYHWRFRSIHGIVLHWMAYTNKYTKGFNTYAVQSLMGRLGEDNLISPSLLKTQSNELVYFFDLMYERTLQIWGEHKYPSIRFYFAVKRDQNLDQMMEYLYLSNSNYDPVTDEDEENEYMVITDLSSLNSKTTYASFQRKITDWHRDSLLKKLTLINYPFSFKKAHCGEYTIEYLSSTLDVIEERIEMHHCIAKYHDCMASSRYAAFKVHGNDERATLGVEVKYNKDGPNQYKFNQCQGHCNSRVSDEMLKTVKDFVGKLASYET